MVINFIFLNGCIKSVLRVILCLELKITDDLFKRKIKKNKNSVK